MSNNLPWSPTVSAKIRRCPLPKPKCTTFFVLCRAQSSDVGLAWRSAESRPTPPPPPDAHEPSLRLTACSPPESEWNPRPRVDAVGQSTLFPDGYQKRTDEAALSLAEKLSCNETALDMNTRQYCLLLASIVVLFTVRVYVCYEYEIIRLSLESAIFPKARLGLSRSQTSFFG